MDARMERDGDGFQLIVERQLAHPPEKVWRVLTERDLLKEWFPSDVEGDWRVGAPLRFIFLHGQGDGLSDEELSGEVLAVDEPHLIEFRWGRETIRYDLRADGEGTRFALSHRIEDAAWGARNAAGWEMCLDNLDLIVEGASAVKFVAEIWRGKFDQYVAKFEPGFGPMDPPPPGEFLAQLEEG